MEPGKRHEWLISDDEEEEPAINLIPEDSDSSDTIEAPDQQDSPPPRPTLNLDLSLSKINKNWWDDLEKPIPEQEQCRIQDCGFAPPGHRMHRTFIRNYSVHETRLIIQYLIHYDVIQNGKGLLVWHDMHSRGYMKHRTVQSLNNNFKKYLLRDIKSFKLPQDIEDKFLELKF